MGEHVMFKDPADREIWLRTPLVTVGLQERAPAIRKRACDNFLVSGVRTQDKNRNLETETGNPLPDLAPKGKVKVEPTDQNQLTNSEPCKPQ